MGTDFKGFCKAFAENLLKTTKNLFVMGLNIGTTVTNTLVFLGHITRKEELNVL